MKTAYDIIIKPIITEQSMEATEEKKYVFQVAIDANKIEIKKAVEEIETLIQEGLQSFGGLHRLFFIVHYWLLLLFLEQLAPPSQDGFPVYCFHHTIQF